MEQMQKRYDHRAIEEKWQRYWKEHHCFAVNEKSGKPKYYVLDMFPYPSGAGLHVGHVEGYTATDIVARHRRQKGYEVLHPMGWDSFGLPAEQHAIRTGTHPAETTAKNIDNYRRQLQALGFSYDWSRELATSDPSYYKWTQWIFTKLYERGLAYEAEMLVNYCPALGTVLANEEVENGRSKEGGHLVERRPLKQWVLKITAYAERLLEDLDGLDWPEQLKRQQIHWIGKSQGVKVHFALEASSQLLSVFTTRPDTLFGVTYMVLSPEHPLVDQLVVPEKRAELAAYRRQCSGKSDLERTELAKEKSGLFLGSYALSPLDGQRLPIWVADYVLMSYGSGAIMAVPAHDERDFAFAQQFGLPVRCVYEPSLEALEKAFPLEDPATVQQEILSAGRCWPGDGRAIHSQGVSVELDGLNVEAAKAKITSWLEEKKKGEAGCCYRLRDWLFARQRYWGEPFPVLHYEDGSMRLLELDELPLTLPPLEQFTPTSEGAPPLARAKEWIELFDSKRGEKARRETNVMPQWAGSCWYYLRFCDPTNSDEPFSREKVGSWLPVDLYVGGAEHAVLHLLYARFWHKVLYDCGLVTTKEPFQKLRHPGVVAARSYQLASGSYVAPEEVVERSGSYYHRRTGELLRSQMEKMSKSKLNGVTPDEMMEEYGADALRLYEMFMGPLDKDKIWNSSAVMGCSRFIQRAYELLFSEKLVDEETIEARQLTHRLAHQVALDIEALYFNTAIAKMMEFLNTFSSFPSYPRSSLRTFAQVLMPFAPHLAEEMWAQLGGGPSCVSLTEYPLIDKKLLEEVSTLYLVQVNGKLRGQIEGRKGLSQEQIEEAASQLPGVQRHLHVAAIKKIIFVPDKLINFVAATAPGATLDAD